MFSFFKVWSNVTIFIEIDKMALTQMCGHEKFKASVIFVSSHNYFMQKIVRTTLALTGILIVVSLGVTQTEAHSNHGNSRHRRVAAQRNYRNLGFFGLNDSNDWIQAYLNKYNIQRPGRSSRSSSSRSSTAPTSSSKSSVSSPKSSSSSRSSVSSSRSSSRTSSSSSSVNSSVSNQLSAIRAEIITLVNQERAKAGRSALKEESHLTTAAQKHAEDMKNQGYFSHTSKDGRSSTDRIRDAGYPLNGSWATGENIAQGQRSAADVMEDWMNSSGHKANILSSNFKEIGVGFYQNTWVQDFASHTN